jgi:adenylate kinase family enzyme
MGRALTVTNAGEERTLRRIAIVGTSGSGKTTMAQRLARQLGIPHVELDALHWGPNWTPAPREVFRQRVEHALSGEAWTTDGNYSAVRDIVWGRADTVVWLDYSLPLIMARMVNRTARRIVTREELWHGNREQLRNAVFARDSILWWPLRTYRRRRRDYPLLFARPENAHLQVVRLRSPQQAHNWLGTLPQHVGPAAMDDRQGMRGELT